MDRIGIETIIIRSSHQGMAQEREMFGFSFAGFSEAVINLCPSDALSIGGWRETSVGNSTFVT